MTAKCAIAEFSRLPYAQHMARTFSARAGDARDAQAMLTYARMQLTARGRMMILSGLAGFNRNVTGG